MGIRPHLHHHSTQSAGEPGTGGWLRSESPAVFVGIRSPYQAARERNPRRWSRHTRNWTPIGAVTLNPERDTAIQLAVSKIPLSGSIGAPAFPSRPGSAPATARSEGEERSRAARSHAQHCEHGENGEHRTFPAASPVARLSPGWR
ncbi:protein of unknown function [Rhodovastum atsumiense]|nr:protein of unknown function [Rhodovastum atsumiense]